MLMQVNSPAAALLSFSTGENCHPAIFSGPPAFRESKSDLNG
ncbi:hypothetical protein [Devosia sp.]|nr:hypothetical protein [Devosia sp.]